MFRFQTDTFNGPILILGIFFFTQKYNFINKIIKNSNGWQRTITHSKLDLIYYFIKAQKQSKNLTKVELYFKVFLHTKLKIRFLTEYETSIFIKVKNTINESY